MREIKKYCYYISYIFSIIPLLFFISELIEALMVFNILGKWPEVFEDYIKNNTIYSYYINIIVGPLFNLTVISLPIWLVNLLISIKMHNNKAIILQIFFYIFGIFLIWYFINYDTTGFVKWRMD